MGWCRWFTLFVGDEGVSDDAPVAISPGHAYLFDILLREMRFSTGTTLKLGCSSAPSLEFLVSLNSLWVYDISFYGKKCD